LSYTDLVLETARAEPVDGEIRVRASVRNQGGRPGRDLVQVYAHRLGASRPSRLVGFGRVDVEAGERAEVIVTIGLEALAVRDVDAHAMVVHPGSYELRVAHHAVDPGLVTTVTVEGEAASA
jgi:hypothetical protein